MLADQALYKILEDYSFKTVLDIGYGEGNQSKLFVDAGKKVTAIDYNPRNSVKGVTMIHADFMDSNLLHIKPFDCIWASHVLEHQFDPRAFLKQIGYFVKKGGIIAITVPPMKHEIVGGHLTWWNAGKLIYTLILSGFDCSHVSIKTYGYNISIILKNVPIVNFDYLDLNYNKHDLKKLEKFFPFPINGFRFNGNIKELNW